MTTPFKMPTNTAEYAEYLDTKLGEMEDRSEISRWWTSLYEQELRKACNISKPDIRILLKKAQARSMELYEERDTSTDRRCDNCKWWDNSRSHRDDVENSGACRALPPVADDRSHLAIWPFTDAADWCANFSSQPDQE